MRVVDYEIFNVPPHWQFLRIETSDGTVGWGEPILEGKARTVRTAVENLMDTSILGEDALRTEHHWQRMYRAGRFRGGPVLMSAISGIDQALWDIKGKHYGAPVYDLLGGAVRDRIRVYHWIGGDTPQEVADAAERSVDRGVSTLKMYATSRVRHLESPEMIERAEDRIAAVRERVGDDVDIALDFHGRVSTPMASQLIAALEPYQPMFVEEPVPPQQYDNLPQIREKTTVPIATGERLYSRWDFKQLLEDQSTHVIQPNVSNAGGVSEVSKVGRMAEAYDVALTLTVPVGPLAFASSLHVAISTSNVILLEQTVDVQPREGDDRVQYLANPEAFEQEGGYIPRPDGVGFGIEIEESRVRDRAGEVEWRLPTWYHEDRSIAEW